MEYEISTDPLRYIYTQLRERIMPESEAKLNNITETFWESLESRIESNEAINIQIRGDPTLGKSTVGATILNEINRALGKDEKTIENLNKLIFSDQIEFIRWIKTGSQRIAIQIDEWNRMVGTGFNATTEMTLFDYYSDVFAQRFVHRVSCAPSEVVDRNCYLFLDIEGRDIEKKVTRCKVIYRDIISGSYMTIGHVDIDVGETIKKEWYNKYRSKKFNRMKLLETNGIRDVRELEFASITLKVMAELTNIAKAKKVDAVLVNKTADIIRREEGRVYSMITMNEITSRTKGILDLITNMESYKGKINKESDIVKRDILKNAYRDTREIFRRVLIDETRLSRLYYNYIEIQE